MDHGSVLQRIFRSYAEPIGLAYPADSDRNVPATWHCFMQH
jgi:hypothetical protein